MLAFEKLVERYRDNVYDLALQMTRSETSALDITQKSFLSAYLHLKEFRTEVDFGAFVRRSAAALTMLQPRGVARTKDELNSPALDEHIGPAEYRHADWSGVAVEEPLSAELRHAIQESTDELPPDQRVVFVFKDLADLTYEQIAEITDQSIPAIKYHLHRARLSLRKAIDHFYGKG